VLKIIIWNANKYLKVEHLQERNVDILLVSEAHFTSRSFFRIHGYAVHCAIPDDRNRGGAAVIINSFGAVYCPPGHRRSWPPDALWVAAL